MKNDFSSLMKQAQQLQARLQESQKKMDDLEIEGTSGGGLVVVLISGKCDIKKLTISPKLMVPEETDILSDLIIAAFNDAKSKLNTKVSEEMAKMMPAGMNIPGLM